MSDVRLGLSITAEAEVIKAGPAAEAAEVQQIHDEEDGQ